MPKLSFARVVGPLAIGLTAACTDPLVTNTEIITDPALATYAPHLNIDIATFTKTSTGLYLKDVPAGWGTAVVLNDTVSVDYTGYLTTGEIFDGSRVNGNFTATFVVKDSAVIKGWVEGLQGMRVGGKRRLVIPPELGYGVFGSGRVPPNAIMIFDITLHGVR